MNEDMTFCDCDCNLECPRNKKNIRLFDIPHSFADMSGIEECRSSEKPVKRLGDGTATWIHEEVRVYTGRTSFNIKLMECHCSYCGTYVEQETEYCPVCKSKMNYPRGGTV